MPDKKEEAGVPPWSNYHLQPKEEAPKKAVPWSNYEPGTAASVEVKPDETAAVVTANDGITRPTFKHKCGACGQEFPAIRGLRMHKMRWCKGVVKDGLGNVPQGDPQSAA